MRSALQRLFCYRGHANVWGEEKVSNFFLYACSFATCVGYDEKKAAGSGRRDKKLSWLDGWLLPPDSVEDGLGERNPS